MLTCLLPSQAHCCICLRDGQAMHRFPCTHEVCVSCAVRLRRYAVRRVRCPICRATTPLRSLDDTAFRPCARVDARRMPRTRFDARLNGRHVTIECAEALLRTYITSMRSTRRFGASELLAAGQMLCRHSNEAMEPRTYRIDTHSVRDARLVVVARR